MKVISSPALRTGRLFPRANITSTHFCYSLSQPQGHSAYGRIRSMKNYNDTIGNRSRDLPACRAVPQLRYRVPYSLKMALWKKPKRVAVFLNYLVIIFNLPKSSTCRTVYITLITEDTTGMPQLKKNDTCTTDQNTKIQDQGCKNSGHLSGATKFRIVAP
jgi:hypothetical protein